MLIIAFDPATKMGWACSQDGNVSSGLWDLSNKKRDIPSVRFLKCWRRLEMFSVVYGSPDQVIYERPANLQGNARKVLPGLQALIETWAMIEGAEIHSYTPSEIKKYATGKGTADKVDMLKRAQELWPQTRFATHDEADARHILRYHLNQQKEKQ